MVSLTDITGAGSTVPIIFPAGLAAWWLQAITSGSGTVRLGDSTVTVSKGLPLASGGGMYTSPVAGQHNFYHSGEFYAYVPVGATLSIGIKEAQMPGQY